MGNVSTESARPLGEWLQQRREELDLSLEQAEEATRIRARYLEALEADDFEALPDLVVGRGFLRNYASFLGLDPQEATSRFSSKVAPAAPEPLPPEGLPPLDEQFRPMPLHKMPSMSRRGRRVGILLLALLVVAGLGALAWWGYPYAADWVARTRATSRPTLVPTFTPAATRAALVTPTEAVTSSSPLGTDSPITTQEAEATPTLELTLAPTFTPSPSPSPSAPIYDGVFVELVFSDTSWVQVTTDGVRQFQGELEAGTYRSWYGEESVELRLGNAGAVQVTVNGQSLGTLGGPGEVVDRVFAKVEGGFSEATLTPEVTGTLTVEATAPPTVAPTEPPTAEPNAGPITPTATISPTAPTTPTTSP